MTVQQQSAGSRKKESSESEREYRRGATGDQYADLGWGHQRRVREGELRDEERHGEPDPCDEPKHDEVPRADPGWKFSESEPQRQPTRKQYSGGFSEQQAGSNAHRYAPDCARARTARHRDSRVPTPIAGCRAAARRSGQLRVWQRFHSELQPR